MKYVHGKLQYPYIEIATATFSSMYFFCILPVNKNTNVKGA